MSKIQKFILQKQNIDNSNPINNKTSLKYFKQQSALYIWYHMCLKHFYTYATLIWPLRWKSKMTAYSILITKFYQVSKDGLGDSNKKS